MKLAVVLTHPVQYYAPLFKCLTNSIHIEIKVYFTWAQWREENYDKDFGKVVEWDVPILEGYKFEFVPNESKHPEIYKFKGINNKTLTDRIEKWQADAILIFGWNYASHFKAMRYFKGKIPVWFRGDSTLIDYDVKGLRSVFKNHDNKFSALKMLIKYKMRKVALSYVYKYIDKAFYVGKANKQYFEEYGLKEEQLIFAPHSVDNEHFLDNDSKQYEIRAREWRRELGIEEDAIVLLFAGKFESKKDPLILVDVLSKYNDLHRNKIKTPFHLVLVGNGMLEEELKTRANNQPTIHLLPFQNQSIMPVVYRLSDLYCLPSAGPNETWGLAINEAFACNRPALVSDKVGCEMDLIEEGKTGYRFEATNESQLLEILLQLDKKELARLGVNAEKKIQSYNYEKTKVAIESAIIAK